MNILLIYATYSGSTELVSELIRTHLLQSDFTVAMKQAHEVTADEFDDYDCIILGTPTWGDGEPHDAFLTLTEQAKGKKYPGKAFAIFGLGDSGYPAFCGAVDYLEKFIKGMEGKLLLESLRIHAFFFNEKENERMIFDWVTRLEIASKNLR